MMQHTLSRLCYLPALLAASALFSFHCGNDRTDKGDETGGAGGSSSQAGSSGASGAAANGAGGSSGRSGGSGSSGSSGHAAPSGGAGSAGAGRGGGGGASAAAGDDLLIDDFEDGDGQSAVGYWYVFTDSVDGGESVATAGASGSDVIPVGAGYNSLHALEVDYTLKKGSLSYDPYVAVGTSFDDGDLSKYQGVSYVYKGGAHSIQLETSDVEDYDYHMYQVAAASSWTTVELPFSVFRQGGWGAKGPVAFNPAHLAAMTMHVSGSSGTVGKLLIDNVKIVRQVKVDSTPDLVIRAPDPPDQTEVPSVAIATDLQALAMSSLDRGYNLTNWLEQGDFDNFDTYGEPFITRLAAAGFKSLRLPIDLDRYARSPSSDAGATSAEAGTPLAEAGTTSADARATSAEAGATSGVVIDPTLFTILDSFDRWTAAHGLGFTIDYHQYDGSLDFSKEATLSLAVELWRQVAQHFAANPRKDLFFELLNEPELSVSGTAPTAAQWTALANRMIAAIRQSDTVHPLVFGDVDWYGITPLSQRTPFSDPNVVYAFHFYEPFIFTHQGASWAGMASTHDVPFPYSEARFSEHSSDFGFTAAMASWQLQDLKNYYRNGNAIALRNRIAEAKNWAVSHNVPVICNEFGVYDATSRMEDRARYYTDLSAIFRELQVPWQIWFMIMDAKTGVVAPEYKTALALDK